MPRKYAYPLLTLCPEYLHHFQLLLYRRQVRGNHIKCSNTRNEARPVKTYRLLRINILNELICTDSFSAKNAMYAFFPPSNLTTLSESVVLTVLSINLIY
ncbi:hypothetical protein FKM82_007480 [Ascaphus truei]